ncbi:MAG: hypothetical protein ACWGSQ_09895 [Longimicrobiales bacterium]
MTVEPDSPPQAEPAAGESPLTSAQIEQLATAIKRAGKVYRAAKVAGITGWTVGVFGVLTLLTNLFSPTAVLGGGALLAVAWNELEGRKKLLRFDPLGARRLARNQLWLLAVIAVYCFWAIYRARARPIPEVGELETLLELGEGFFTTALVAFHAVVLALAVLVQGGMYRYHAARIRLVEEYLARTPTWIVEVQRVLRSG